MNTERRVALRKRIAGAGWLPSEQVDWLTSLIEMEVDSECQDDRKLAALTRQLWKDWSSGYDALASDQWDQIKALIESKS